MKFSLFLLVVLTLVEPGPALWAADAPVSAGWKELNKSADLIIYGRKKENSAIRELKAVGTIDAPNWVVKNVIDDLDDHEKFMPYTVESKIVSREGNVTIGYQRLSTPMVADRDYTIRIRSETRQRRDGRIVYQNRWESANDQGPAETKGVVRVKTNEGSWLFEPLDGGKRTQVTYSIYTDPGGSIPQFIINAANTKAIPKVFAAMRKAVKDEKYGKKKPADP